MMTILALVRYIWLAYRRSMRVAFRFDRELREFLQEVFVDPYRVRLLAQAEHLYRNSALFKVRLKELGYVPAVEGFHGGVALYFFEKARRESWSVRFRLARDAFLNSEPRAYGAGTKEDAQ